MKNNPIVSLYGAYDKPYQIKDTGLYIAPSIIGTGFFMSPHIVITCEHVVGKRKQVKAAIKYSNKEVHALGKVIFVCKRLDFALVEFPDAYTRMHIGVSVPLDVECEIICPHEKKSPYTGRMVYNSTMGDYLESVAYMLEGQQLPPGTSGSPLIYEGKAVGMHYSGGFTGFHSEKSLCVPMSYIVETIRKKYGDVR